MRYLNFAVCVGLVAFLSSCATPRGVTQKPDIAPVQKSTERIKASTKKSQATAKEQERVNVELGTNIDTVISDLKSLLGQ